MGAPPETRVTAPVPRLPPAHPARLILILSLAPTVGLGIGRFAYSLVLPDMRDGLCWSYAAAGFMNTINAAGYLAGALMASRLARRFGLSAAVRWGTLACLVSLALCPLSGNFFILSFARLLAGLAGARRDCRGVSGEIGAEIVGWAKAFLRRAHHIHSNRIEDGGHAELIIGRAFARPVGSAHPTGWSHLTSAERIVALVFPVAALVVVGDFHRDHVFRILESEFGRHPDLHRKAIGAGQDFVGEFERHLGLRMQRGAHIERAVVAFGIRALEPAIFGARVGADQLEEIAQRRAGPASDRAH